MPPALRQRPMYPACAAADLASPLNFLPAHPLLGALTPDPPPGTGPVRAVTR